MVEQRHQAKHLVVFGLKASAEGFTSETSAIHGQDHSDAIGFDVQMAIETSVRDTLAMQSVARIKKQEKCWCMLNATITQLSKRIEASHISLCVSRRGFTQRGFTYFI